MNRREKRDQREQEIIEVAVGMLSETGFLDMRMSDIADATGHSMGTIYSHFESKEDLIVACAHTLCQDELLLFEDVAAQPIPDIEKIITLAQCSWLISRHHPKLIEIDTLSLMASVWRRATAYRAEQLSQQHSALATTFRDIVLKTIGHGINGHEERSDEEKGCMASYLTHGMWGLCVGLMSTTQSGYASTLCPADGDQAYTHFSSNYIRFLKGYGWQEAKPEAVFADCLDIARDCLNRTTWFGLSMSGTDTQIRS
ncbi:MAG: TetR family transcriptional regulator [Gammaproteobacteria bacterium]|nr:TetR family transcriptional regulator [Gammaproteobacteria bacterium]